ncbi:hypothetical protein STENM327S_08348 [Streptomyces tendae]
MAAPLTLVHPRLPRAGRPSLLEDLLVQPDRAARDRVPAELLHRARPARLAHPAGARRIAEYGVQCACETRLEVVVRRRVPVTLLGDEYPRFAVGHDLGDPAHPGGHHGGGAGHRLQVDDAEGLVDGGADEDGGVGQELDHLRARQHARDPVHALAGAAQLGEEVAELPVDLGGVRSARAQHDLRGRVDVPYRAQQVGHALLARDAADEKDVGAGAVQADPVQRVGAVVGPVEPGVDAVVHDVDRGGVQGRVAAEDVLAHRAGDGDHRVGRLDRGALGPAGQAVPAAELLGLPGSQGLQGVGGHHVRDAVEELGEVAAEVGVPGVGVHQFAPFEGGGHGEVDREGAQRVVGAVERGPGAVAQYAVAAALAPAVHVQVDQAGELPGQELDVDSGAAVHVRRELTAQQSHAHPEPPVSAAGSLMVTQSGRLGKTAEGPEGSEGSGSSSRRRRPRPAPGSTGSSCGARRRCR